jgi:transposase-like protein
VVALFMDGVVIAQQTMIVVLGITRDGHKAPLGLRLGSTENAVVCSCGSQTWAQRTRFEAGRAPEQACTYPA